MADINIIGSVAIAIMETKPDEITLDEEKEKAISDMIATCAVIMVKEKYETVKGKENYA